MGLQIPVYVFAGFLEAGKTKAIQETLEDQRFNDNERTLLLLLEEGIEEYDISRFPGKNVFIETLENEEDLTSEHLKKLYKKHKFERVIVEYNGMWQFNTLFENLPDRWFIYQLIMFADAKTFSSYNQNMRSLMVDKLRNTEMIVFNRADDKTDKTEIHKIVRGISRRCAIAYENADGTMEYDETEDPLPFDIDSEVIDIADRDFALWWRDMSEEMDKYIGKTVRFKGIVAVADKFGPNTIVCGRHVMTCCVDDIEYKGLVGELLCEASLNNRDWVIVTAKFTKEYHKLYKCEGPVLKITEAKKSSVPEEEVATFY